MHILEIVMGRDRALVQEYVWTCRLEAQGMPLLANRLGPPPTPDTGAFSPLRPDLTVIADCPIMFVHLPDDCLAIILQPICNILHLDYLGQLHRIYRNEALAKHLLAVPILTNGLVREMEVLLSSAIPRWLDGIQVNRLAPEKRPLVLALREKAPKMEL